MEQTLTMAAARRLGISRTRVRQLVKEGILPVRDNPLDRRQRLIPLSAIEQLERAMHPRKPRPQTIGIVSDGSLQSDQVDRYLEANWHPD